METNYIFGVRPDFAEQYEKIHRAFVVSGAGSGIRTGTPCLALLNATKEVEISQYIRSGRSAVGIIPFSMQQGANNRCIFDLNTDNLIVEVYGETNLLDRIVSFETEMFNVREDLPVIMGRALNEDIPTTVVVKNGKNLRTSLLEMDNEISKQLKFFFNPNTKKNGCQSLVPGETCICCLTFVNAKNVIPAFTSNFNSIFINIAIVYPKRSESSGSLISSYEINLLYSDTLKGIKMIDGLNIGLNQCSNSKLVSILSDKKDYFNQVGDSKPENKSGKIKMHGLKEKSNWEKTATFAPISSKFHAN
jgi:hypothetical protein